MTIVRGGRRKWWTLVAVTFGLFLIMLDNTVVTVALPSIRQDLGLDLAELEWVVAAYALTFAALMLTGGKLADAFGRRRIYVIGLAAFSLASLWCGLSASGGELIAARVAQGAAAALMNPATLSIVTATFPPRQRGTAIGIWAGSSALALAIGPLVGGLLTEQLSWHWVFFVNIPVGAVGIVASFLLIDESRDETHRSLDVPGLLTSGTGLFALTYALIEGNAHGWSSARIIGSFAVAVVSLTAFLLIERRRRSPMLDLSLFSNRTYLGANIAVLLAGVTMFGVLFYISLFLQNVLDYSPVETGAAFLPMTIVMALTAPAVGRVVDRLGSRWLVSGGMALLTLQLLLFTRLDESSSWRSLLPALIAGGIGISCVMTPASATAMKSVPVDKAGVGSAVLNTCRQVGGSIGIALIGAIVAVHAGGETSAHAFVVGLNTALYVVAAIAAAGAVLAGWLIRLGGTASHPTTARRASLVAPDEVVPESPEPR